MALMKCKECGGDVSSKAAACPKCGAKVPPKTKVGTWIVAAIAAAVVGSCVLGANDGKAKREQAQAAAAAIEAAKSPEERNKEAAEKLAKEVNFQRILKGAKLLKAGAKDPDSFKLETALLMPDGTVCYQFRAKNSFNAVVPGQYVLREKGGGASDASWSKYCAGKSGQDFKYVRAGL